MNYALTGEISQKNQESGDRRKETGVKVQGTRYKVQGTGKDGKLLSVVSCPWSVAREVRLRSRFSLVVYPAGS